MVMITVLVILNILFPAQATYPDCSNTGPVWNAVNHPYMEGNSAPVATADVASNSGYNVDRLESCYLMCEAYSYLSSDHPSYHPGYVVAQLGTVPNSNDNECTCLDTNDLARETVGQVGVSVDVVTVQATDTCRPDACGVVDGSSYYFCEGDCADDTFEKVWVDEQKFNMIAGPASTTEGLTKEECKAECDAHIGFDWQGDSTDSEDTDSCRCFSTFTMSNLPPGPDNPRPQSVGQYVTLKMCVPVNCPTNCGTCMTANTCTICNAAFDDENQCGVVIESPSEETTESPSEQTTESPIEEASESPSEETSESAVFVTLFIIVSVFFSY